MEENIDNQLDTTEKRISASWKIVTVVLTVGVAVLKFFKFIYDKGQLSYWKINSIAISEISEKNLYEIILSIVFYVAILIIMILPAIIVKTKIKVGLKILFLFLFHSGLSLYIFITSKYWLLVGHYKPATLTISFILVSLLYASLFYGIGFWIVFGVLSSDIKNNRNSNVETQENDKNAETKSKKNKYLVLVIVFLGWIGVLSLLLLISGKSSQSEIREFRIVNEEYAIVYETEEYYYLVEYDSKNKTIDKSKQMIIEKADVKYVWQTINNSN